MTIYHKRPTEDEIDRMDDEHWYKLGFKDSAGEPRIRQVEWVDKTRRAYTWGFFVARDDGTN